jgi:hypothetical protein
MGAVVLAHAEDGDDVGVVQPGRRPRLALEAMHLPVACQRPRRQDLERHAPAERLLLGLVDDAHAAPPDLAHDAVLAQALRRPHAEGRLGRTGRAGVFQDHQGAEQFAYLASQLQAAARVIAQRRPLATTVALHELVGKLGQGVDGGIGVGHAGALVLRRMKDEG